MSKGFRQAESEAESLLRIVTIGSSSSGVRNRNRNRQKNRPSVLFCYWFTNLRISSTASLLSNRFP